MIQMWNEMLEQPEVLAKCINQNNETIKQIVRQIERKRIECVVLAARGTSDHAAIYGKYIIEYSTGIPVSLAAPSIYTVYHKNVKLENCIVIGISQSGKAADVLEVVRSAKEAGAITISITNDAQSPLATQAQYHLDCNAGQERSVAATKTFTTQLMQLLLLVSEWTKDEVIKTQLSSLPENMKKVLNSVDVIKSKVERYRYIDECFVLARGINYAIALESALKIQETSYVKAKAYATSDFYHGPFAMIEKDTPVIVYAPEGPSLEYMTEMIVKLKENGAELIIVSNNKELLEMGNCSLEIPQTDNDFLSPFYNVAIAQMFACHLALTKGLNPDLPRGLNKVTITK